MSNELGDPGFWLALAASLAASGCLIWWLITGGRKRPRPPKNHPTAGSGV